MKTKVSYLLMFFAVACAVSVLGFAQGGGGQRGPQAPPPPFKPTASDTLKTNDGDLKITPVNHAGVMFQLGNGVLYVDPVGNYSELPKADAILITDIHGDHMDPDSIKEISKAGTVIISSPAVAQTVTTATPIANGEAKTWQTWSIEAIPAYNIKRGPAPGKLFHDKGRGNGYVLTYGGKRFYFSGDTEGIPEMRALKNIDVAFVCMNLPYTMPPEEAADAVKAFHPKVHPVSLSRIRSHVISKSLARHRHRSPPLELVSQPGVTNE